MRFIRYLIWILIIIAGIFFSLINQRMVEIDYYLGSTTLFLPLLIVIAAVAGALLMILIMMPPILKLNHINRQLKRQLSLQLQDKGNGH